MDQKEIPKRRTVHTSRTMMFAELYKVMNYAISEDQYLKSLNQNIANKRTKSNQDKTTVYLKRLYKFDLKYYPFLIFKYFWQISSEIEKPIISLLYALGEDFLLSESIPLIISTKLGDKVAVEILEENIEILYPTRYSLNTKKSLAQNIASSWKQAGFITGKVRNIRTQPNIGYHSVAFAFLMAYCNGKRGDFILTSNWSKTLCLGDAKLRELAVEAAKRDLSQYQYAGSVTSISFNNLFNKLGINGI